MTSVSIRNVTKVFGPQEVLAGAHMDLPEGGILALLGPSGCGKTTLLRLIAGFEAIDGGEIVVNGVTVAAPGRAMPPEKRRIGYVPQEGALFPHLTVAGNVGYGLARRDRTGPRVGEVLRLTGLSDLAERYPHELSGGQQQRTALARALAPRPDIVLLDEPFNALDLDLRRSLCEEVTAMLRQSRATAILVTHDPEEAFSSADRIAVMQHGRIAQCADAATVYLDPATRAVARMTGESLFVNGTLHGEHLRTDLGDLPVTVRGARPACGTAVTGFLRPEQVRIATGETACRADVVGCTFRGNTTIVTLQAATTRVKLPVIGHFQAEAGQSLFLDIEGSCIVFSDVPPSETG